MFSADNQQGSLVAGHTPWTITPQRLHAINSNHGSQDIVQSLWRHKVPRIVTPWGYYGMMGWSRFREDALIRGESQSSIS